MLKLFGYALILSGIFFGVRSQEETIKGSNFVTSPRSGRTRGEMYAHKTTPQERYLNLGAGIFMSFFGFVLLRKDRNRE